MSHAAYPGEAAAPADEAYLHAISHLYALGQELAPSPPLPDGTPAPRRKWDLAHMRSLCATLGDPQNTFPSVLIAGTNGKGSTAATLASILSAAGYKTGLYTSPHLIRVNERIQILNGQRRTSSEQPGSLNGPSMQPRRMGGIDAATQIPDQTFARLYFKVDDTASKLIHEGTLPHHPSFFEVLTALAFLYFAEGQVDIVILEVGLGGRLDATNIVDPLLSVITDIALDHQDYLGNTITEITREKAGILRANGTLVTLPQHPEANQAIGEAAALLNLQAISAADFIPPQTPSHNWAVVPDPNSISIVASDHHETVLASETRESIIPGNTHETVILSEASRNASPRDAQSKDLLSPLPLPVLSHLPETPGILSAAKDCKGADATTITRPLHPEIQFPLPRNRYTLNLDNQPLEVDSPLAGHHQQRNIALAIATATALRNPQSYKFRISNQISYNITKTSIEKGIYNTRWPGRLEFLPPNLLLDVAHNPAGAWTLRAAIARLPENQPRTLLFSCLADKDLTEMSRILFPLFDSSADRPHDHIVLAPIDNPRAAKVEDLLTAAHALGIPAHAAPHLAAALAQARAVTPVNGLIIATGSVYLIGAVRGLALTPER